MNRLEILMALLKRGKASGGAKAMPIKIIIKCPYCGIDREEVKGSSFSAFCSKECFINHRNRRK